MPGSRVSGFESWLSCSEVWVWASALRSLQKGGNDSYLEELLGIKYICTFGALRAEPGTVSTVTRAARRPDLKTRSPSPCWPPCSSEVGSE